MKDLIGRLDLRTPGGFPLQANLQEDGMWVCPECNPLADYLNLFFPPSGSPNLGPFGTYELNEAARQLGGTATPLRIVAPRPDGVF